jgi:hypothetical protein
MWQLNKLNKSASLSVWQQKGRRLGTVAAIRVETNGEIW